MNRSNLLTLLVVLVSIAGLLTVNAARAEELYGLTDTQQLVMFDSDSRAITSSTPITGLGGSTLLAIDFRPSTGQLYGLSTANRFYTINPTTGASTPVGNALSLIDIVKSFDFDPVNDQIRLETNLRKNIVVNPTTGAVASNQTLLNFAAGDPHAGSAPQVVAMAYTNSYSGAGSTTLFNLEALNDVLTMQTPQSAGTLSTIGGLGIPLGTLLSVNGMDISGATGIGYVVGSNMLGNGMTANALYTIDLSTGALSLAGDIAPMASPFGQEYGGGGGGGNGCPPGGGSPFQIIDVATVSTVPEPSTFALAAICCGLGLVRFARRRTRRRQG